MWALCKYDVFLLSCNNSFFRFKEFPILKKLGKKIVYTFHGTDSRPAYIDGFALDLSKIQGNHISDTMLEKFISITYRRWGDVRKVERYADVIIQNIPTAIFHHRPFVPYLLVGIPINNSTLQIPIRNKQNRNSTDSVRILHSPSHPAGKGTAKIRDAIESLRQEGYSIDYIELIGKPNVEVLKEIQQCDFIVDQLYSATPMAVFVSEAASFGKPAVVGGYYSEYLRADLCEDLIPPSLFCHPDQIKSAIKKLIVNKNFRIELGKKANEFVTKNWEPKCVARRYIRLIENNYPQDWLYIPKNQEYILGGGIPKEKARIIIRSIIKKYGKDALFLNDKPALMQKFIDFAFSKT
jgi:hypothetical protein